METSKLDEQRGHIGRRTMLTGLGGLAALTALTAVDLRSASPAIAAGTWQWPNGSTTIPNVSSEFGKRVSPGGIGSTNHRGIDLTGFSSVRAASDGEVIHAGLNGGEGNSVHIAHAGGFVTKYFHMANGSIKVSQGNAVSVGTVLGTMGATGAVTGVHLHFETIVDGVYNNPRDFMAARLSSPPAPMPTPVIEAASNAGWAPGFPGIAALDVAAFSLDGVKYLYSIFDGYVHEANSSNQWINLNTGVRGTSVAAMTMGGVKYLYVIDGGVVHEAASNAGWASLSTGIQATSVAAMSLNGTKLIYSVAGGFVHEAASSTGWLNQNTGIPADTVSVLALAGVKYVYTRRAGSVWESHSADGWTPRSTGIPAGLDLAVLALNGVKYVYTSIGGYVHEAHSANAWRPLNTGVPGNSLSVAQIDGVKLIYAH
jgi:hypothetical protein